MLIGGAIMAILYLLLLTGLFFLALAVIFLIVRALTKKRGFTVASIVFFVLTAIFLAVPGTLALNAHFGAPTDEEYVDTHTMTYWSDLDKKSFEHEGITYVWMADPLTNARVGKITLHAGIASAEVALNIKQKLLPENVFLPTAPENLYRIDSGAGDVLYYCDSMGGVYCPAGSAERVRAYYETVDDWTFSINGESIDDELTEEDLEYLFEYDGNIPMPPNDERGESLHIEYRTKDGLGWGWKDPRPTGLGKWYLNGGYCPDSLSQVLDAHAQ